jgi:hypothetical protein
MTRIHVETVVETDGELTVRDLPCRKGDRVEAIVLINDAAGDAVRASARQRFLMRARGSAFRSVSSYPSREQLHDRS